MHGLLAFGTVIHPQIGRGFSVRPIPYSIAIVAQVIYTAVMKALGHARDSADSLRILCAEDDPEWGNLLVRLLTRAGHSVQHAADGSAAWKVLLKSFDQIDLIVTDNQMPGFTGLELVHLIRQTAYSKGLIVHCGALSERERASYVSLRVDHIVLKDVSSVELLAAVEAVRSQIKQSS
jgi:CheY-like chemotaxis protein